MTSFADLHLHTAYSDGTYSPRQLIQLARKYGISAIAITDHDTVEGIKEAIECGLEEEVEIIPGIELSAQISNEEIHILGYFINWQNAAFKHRLLQVKNKRAIRLKKMVEHLYSLGVKIDYEDLLTFCGEGTAGRLHLAQYLVKKGIVPNITSAFDIYIGKGKPAYEPVNLLSLEDAIHLIRDLGGIAVYAHPGINNLDTLIPHMVSLGLGGIEVFHSSHNKREIQKYLNIARENNLAVTGGSDCHQAAKNSILLGSIKIDYSYVEKLKKSISKMGIIHNGLHSANI